MAAPVTWPSPLSSGASRWWHTRADTDDYDDNISWRTAFDGSDLGLNLASAARTPLTSSLTIFPTDARLVKERKERHKWQLRAEKYQKQLAPLEAEAKVLKQRVRDIVQPSKDLGHSDVTADPTVQWVKCT